MQAVAAVFARRPEAERAASALEALGLPRDRITLLTPGTDPRRVPTDEGEQPGVGAALGAVVGGATGAAVGVPLGALMTLLVPGVGPVIATTVLGAALLGAGGAAVGATLEDSLSQGLPRDELFVYEDALRRGHSVVVALVENTEEAEAVRQLFTAAAAETVDAARDRWWLGLRSAEREGYAGGAPAFERDEAVFRRGFEAALGAASRGRSWDELAPVLRARFGPDAEAPAFRRGWERGTQYYHDLTRRPDLRKSA
jgi:hypothetical protein